MTLKENGWDGLKQSWLNITLIEVAGVNIYIVGGHCIKAIIGRVVFTTSCAPVMYNYHIRSCQLSFVMCFGTADRMTSHKLLTVIVFVQVSGPRHGHVHA